MFSIFFSRNKIALISFLFLLICNLLLLILLNKPVIKKNSLPDLLSYEKFITLTLDEKLSYIKKISEDNQIIEVWKYLLDIYKDNSQEEAHDIAHYVGYLINQNEGDSGLYICTSDFAFGCYHGFFESAFQNNIEDINFYSDKCSLAGVPNSGPWSSCIHGIGHGVATYFNSDDLFASLRTCDLLNAGSHYCHDGVFMEFSMSSSNLEIQNDSFVKFCEEIDTKYQKACARNIVLIMTTKQNKNIEEVIIACTKSKSSEVINTCTDSVGLSLVHLYNTDYEKIFNKCSLFKNTSLVETCVSAAAGEYVFQDIPNWEKLSISLCDFLDQIGTAECINNVNIVSKNYSRQ